MISIVISDYVHAIVRYSYRADWSNGEAPRLCGVTVTCHTCIREILGSNLGCHTGYSD
jgi:hypothetical protein